MSLIYNGTTVKKVIYNGTEIKKLYYGSTLVFSASTVWYDYANSNYTIQSSWINSRSDDSILKGMVFGGSIGGAGSATLYTTRPSTNHEIHKASSVKLKGTWRRCTSSGVAHYWPTYIRACGKDITCTKTGSTTIGYYTYDYGTWEITVAPAGDLNLQIYLPTFGNFYMAIAYVEAFS